MSQRVLEWTRLRHDLHRRADKVRERLRECDKTQPAAHEHRDGDGKRIDVLTPRGVILEELRRLLFAAEAIKRHAHPRRGR